MASLNSRVEHHGVDDDNSPTSAQPQQQQSAIVIDSPYWGSPTACSLVDLLRQLDRNQTILYESPNYLALNKPADLRMDGPYPATIHKLLTYWYPPASVVAAFAEEAPAPHDKNEPATSETVAETGVQQQPQHQQTFQQFIVDRYHRHSDHVDNEMRPTHQLDYATSGVLLIARNKAAANAARGAFERRLASKSYLAMVRGRVDATQFPLLHKDISQIQEQFAVQERLHRKQRDNQRKAAGRQGGSTFPGFQPPHALYQRWQQYQKKLLTQSSGEAAAANEERNTLSNERENQDENGSRAGQKKPRLEEPSNTNNHPQPDEQQPSKRQQELHHHHRKVRLRDEQWEQVWQELEHDDGNNEDDMDETAIKTRQNNWANLKANPEAFKWKQVKDDLGLGDRFQRAANVHNDFLRQCKLDALAAANAALKAEGAQLSASLPIVFRLVQDGAKNGAEDNAAQNDPKEESTTSSSTFYICASIAEVDGQFSVVLQRSETATFGLHPRSHLLHQSGSDASLLFRPSLTRCTILQHYNDQHNEKTKVLLEPYSGRRHQLRIHMALVGHVIVGDVTYRRKSSLNNQSRLGKRRQDEDRMCLHAHTLKIPLTPKKTDHKKKQRKEDLRNDDETEVLELTAPDPFTGLS